MHWAIWDAMFKAQNAFEGVISNFPNRFIAAVMRRVVFPLGRPYVVPSDKLGHDVARLLIEPSATRDRLTAGMYLSQATDNPLAQIERALAATIAAEPIEAKLRAAVKDGRVDAKLPPGEGADALDRARGRGRRDHRRGGRGARRGARAHREGDPRRRFRAGPRRVGDAARAGSAAGDASPSVTHKREAPAREAPAAVRSSAARSAEVRHERADLHRRRRAHAVPQIAQPAGAVRGVGSRDGRRPRAARCASRSRRRISTR